MSGNQASEKRELNDAEIDLISGAGLPFIKAIVYPGNNSDDPNLVTHTQVWVVSGSTK
jgi:hypothetical protein